MTSDPFHDRLREKGVPEQIPGHVNPHARNLDRIPCLELRAQSMPHDDGSILGNRAGLEALRAAIDQALQEHIQMGEVEVFAADGEGYTLSVHLMPNAHDRAWQEEDMGSPYTEPGPR